MEEWRVFEFESVGFSSIEGKYEKFRCGSFNSLNLTKFKKNAFERQRKLTLLEVSLEENFYNYYVKS